MLATALAKMTDISAEKALLGAAATRRRKRSTGGDSEKAYPVTSISAIRKANPDISNKPLYHAERTPVGVALGAKASESTAVSAVKSMRSINDVYPVML